MSETENLKQQNKEGGSPKKKGAIIALIIVIVALVCVILFLVFHNKEDEKRNVVVTPDNVDQVLDQMAEEEHVEPGYYTVTMSNVWHFANGSAVSDDAYVENKTENTNDVYFDIFLADDEENAIYKSPVIPVGSSLENIALDTTLEDGTYDCVMIYHLVDDEQNTLSTLRVTVTLVIGSGSE